jgi:hypothetical protein
VGIADRPSSRRLLLAVTAASALISAGCGGGTDTPYPVRGTVYLDGQAAAELAGGTVTFNSTELHKSASGEIQPNGTYRLGALTRDDGALPGRYEVTVSPPETSGAGERGGRHPSAKSVPFTGPTPREVTVEAKSNDIPVHLHRGGAARR